VGSGRERFILIAATTEQVSVALEYTALAQAAARSRWPR